MGRLRSTLAAGFLVPDLVLTEALFQAMEIFRHGRRREKLAAGRLIVQMTRCDLAVISKQTVLTPDAKALRELLFDSQPDPPRDPPGDCAEGLRGDGE
jgi:hypothetical protein